MSDRAARMPPRTGHMARTWHSPPRLGSQLARLARVAAMGALLACSGAIEAPAEGEGLPGAPSADAVGGDDPSAGSVGGSGGAGGATGGAPSDDTIDPDGPGGDPPIDCSQAAIDPGPAPLRLLTRAQYVSTVRDLFGAERLSEDTLHDALGPASEASAFGLLQPDVTQVELEGFQRAAEVIAARVVGDTDALDELAPCAQGDDAASCARDAIESFGARLYRAPITEDDDVDRHLALFESGAATSYAHGIELLLRGMLQAPRFLYRVELGSDEVAGDTAVRLSPHELAARLSYLAWGSAPDRELIEAAERGELDTQAGVDAQLARLLDDPRGQTLVRRFLAAWAHVTSLYTVVKDAEMFPEWEDPALRDAFTAQAASFFDHVLGEEGGTLSALLTSHSVPVNETLADFYGVSSPSGTAFQSIDLPAERASGVLTLPALLARLAKPDESSPIYRGKFVREALLCQDLPSPPANVPKPPEVEAGVSTRERLRQHEVDGACSACHQLLDPIGFGFERFDAIGRYRTEDGGEAVDSSGAIHQTRDADGAFDGVAELGARLAGSAEVQECMVRQWFRYALDRFEQDVDACTLHRLVEAFQASGQDLRALPKAVVRSDAFLYRRPIEESSP